LYYILVCVTNLNTIHENVNKKWREFKKMLKNISKTLPLQKGTVLFLITFKPVLINSQIFDYQ